MTLLTEDDLIAALPGQYIPCHKNQPSYSTGQTCWISHWELDGCPSIGKAPIASPGETLDRTVAGALPLTNAGAGQKLYIVRADGSGAGGNAATFLYDRLMHCTFDPTIITLQNLNTVALTRFTDGKWVSLFVEARSDFTPSVNYTLTVNYVNQAGGASSTSMGFGGTQVRTGRVINVPLANGDYGVRSVTSVQMGTGFTAGTIAVVLARLIFVPTLTPLAAYDMDAYDCGLAYIPNDACLYYVSSSSNTVAKLASHLRVVSA